MIHKATENRFGLAYKDNGNVPETTHFVERIYSLCMSVVNESVFIDN